MFSSRVNVNFTMYNLGSSCSSGVIAPYIHLGTRSWVTNPRFTRLYYSARDHVCKLCIYNQNYTIIWAVSYTTYYFSLAAREPGHSSGVVFDHKKDGRPALDGDTW